jgi:hypothetical protein
VPETISKIRSWLNWIKSGAIHPLILPVFPVLSLYLSNMGQGFLPQATMFLGGTFVLTIAGWILVYKIMMDRNKSALIISAFFVLFFSFGHGLTVLRVILERLNLLDALWFVLYAQHARMFWAVIWILLFASLTLLIVKCKHNFKKLTGVLNFIAMMLTLVAVGNFFLADGFRLYLQPLISQITSSVPEQDTASPTIDLNTLKYQTFLPFISKSEPSDPRSSLQFEQIWLQDFPAGTSEAQHYPDIYYIIPDMYIRADYLADLYQCDISGFLSFLEERGFYVAHDSRSNYAFTTHSLASSLNYTYINDIAKQVGHISGHSLSAQMIQQSRIFTFLESQGYTTVAFATGFWFTELENADIYMEPTKSNWTPSEFESGVIKLTPLSAFSIFGDSRDEAYRRRTLYTLEHIADAASIDGPTFVFAHILSPHDPYIFNAYGGPVASQDEYTYEEYKKVYCDQVLYINRRLQEVVDEILARSPEPPIIIIQGDHGAVFGVDYAAHVNERMSILNTYYFPDQNHTGLYPEITPVNTFRIVLNDYFGANYALLDDISYFGASYDFMDVTQEVIKLAP